MKTKIKKHYLLGNVSLDTFNQHTRLVWHAVNDAKLIKELVNLNLNESIKKDNVRYTQIYVDNYTTDNCSHKPCIQKGEGCLFKGSHSSYYRVAKNKCVVGVIRVSDHWNGVINRDGELHKSDRCKMIDKCGSNHWYLAGLDVDWDKSELVAGIYEPNKVCVERASYNNYDDPDNWKYWLNNENRLAYYDIISHPSGIFDYDTGTIRLNYDTSKNIKKNTTQFESRMDRLQNYLNNFKQFVNLIKNDDLKNRILSEFALTNKLLKNL